MSLSVRNSISTSRSYSKSINNNPVRRPFAMQSEEEGLVCSSSSHSYTTESDESYNTGTYNSDKIYTYINSLVKGHLSYRLKNNSVLTIESDI
jgi:hypothetical protein